MITLSKKEVAAIRKRLEKTSGGIKGAAELGGITKRVAHKMLAGGNCRKETVDAFLSGIAALEKKETMDRIEISQKALACA